MSIAMPVAMRAMKPPSWVGASRRSRRSTARSVVSSSPGTRRARPAPAGPARVASTSRPVSAARTMIYYLDTPDHHSTVTRFLQHAGRLPLAPILRVVAYPAGVLEGAQRARRSGAAAQIPAHASAASSSNPSTLSARSGATRRSRPPSSSRTSSGCAAPERRSARRRCGRGSTERRPRPQAAQPSAARAPAGCTALLQAGSRTWASVDFAVYRPGGARRPRRYPVFLRREDDHGGSRSSRSSRRPRSWRARCERARAGSGREPPRSSHHPVSARAPTSAGLYQEVRRTVVIGGRILAGRLFFGPPLDVEERRPRSMPGCWRKARLSGSQSARRRARPHLRDRGHRLWSRRLWDRRRPDRRYFEINTNPGIPSGYTPRPPSPRDEVDRRFNETLLDAFRALSAAATGAGLAPAPRGRPALHWRAPPHDSRSRAGAGRAGSSSIRSRRDDCRDGTAAASGRRSQRARAPSQSMPRRPDRPAGSAPRPHRPGARRRSGVAQRAPPSAGPRRPAARATGSLPSRRASGARPRASGCRARRLRRSRVPRLRSSRRGPARRPPGAPPRSAAGP